MRKTEKFPLYHLRRRLNGKPGKEYGARNAQYQEDKTLEGWGEEKEEEIVTCVSIRKG